jgi:hypothetical protein
MEKIPAIPELTSLRKAVARASLTPEVMHTTLYCLDQLPKLYADLGRTNESRFADTIAALSQAVVKRLGEESTVAAGRVAEALVAKLDELHERVGLAPLRLKVAAPVGAAGKRRR